MLAGPTDSIPDIPLMRRKVPGGLASPGRGAWISLSTIGSGNILLMQKEDTQKTEYC
jgi:hypothetical protein